MTGPFPAPRKIRLSLPFTLALASALLLFLVLFFFWLLLTFMMFGLVVGGEEVEAKQQGGRSYEGKAEEALAVWRSCHE